MKITRVKLMHYRITYDRTSNEMAARASELASLLGARGNRVDLIAA
jgi:hypothetical protein